MIERLTYLQNLVLVVPEGSVLFHGVWSILILVELDFVGIMTVLAAGTLSQQRFSIVEKFEFNIRDTSVTVVVEVVAGQKPGDPCGGHGESTHGYEMYVACRVCMKLCYLT